MAFGRTGLSLYCDAAESRPRPNHVAPNAERPNHVAPNATTVQWGLQWPPLAAGAALGECTVLERLNLANCNGLLSLPERLGECTVLQELELNFCTDLLSLPERLGECTSLQTLMLRDCMGRCRSPTVDIVELAHKLS